MQHTFTRSCFVLWWPVAGRTGSARARHTTWSYYLMHCQPAKQPDNLLAVERPVDALKHKYIKKYMTTPRQRCHNVAAVTSPPRQYARVPNTAAAAAVAPAPWRRSSTTGTRRGLPLPLPLPPLPLRPPPPALPSLAPAPTGPQASWAAAICEPPGWRKPGAGRAGGTRGRWRRARRDVAYHGWGAWATAGTHMDSQVGEGKAAGCGL